MADEGYCMKCRTKREFEGQVVTLKNGRPAAQGLGSNSLRDRRDRRFLREYRGQIDEPRPVWVGVPDRSSGRHGDRRFANTTRPGKRQ